MASCGQKLAAYVPPGRGETAGAALTLLRAYRAVLRCWYGDEADVGDREAVLLLADEAVGGDAPLLSDDEGDTVLTAPLAKSLARRDHKLAHVRRAPRSHKARSPQNPRGLFPRRDSKSRTAPSTPQGQGTDAAHASGARTVSRMGLGMVDVASVRLRGEGGRERAVGVAAAGLEAMGQAEAAAEDELSVLSPMAGAGKVDLARVKLKRRAAPAPAAEAEAEPEFMQRRMSLRSTKKSS